MNSVASALSQSNRLAGSGARMLLILLRARAFLVLAVLLLAFSIFVPSFASLTNLSILSKHIAISAILAIGMTFVVLAGGIDLSVGSVVGLSGMIAGDVLLHSGLQGSAAIFTAIAAALLVGATVGALNGWLVSKAGVASFIATLGTLYIARGAALLLSGGKTFPNVASSAHRTESFTLIGQSHALGIPGPVWLLAVLFAVAALIATRTPLGRHIYAVGGNERAARLAGIEVPRAKLFTYLFSGVCAAMVGLIIASQLEAAHPATGETFELNAIAAVVLGGTSLAGGRGSMTGSLIGACVISVLADGLIMLGVSEFWQIVVKGLVIVLAVAIDQLQGRLQARLLPFLLRSNPKAGGA